MEDYYDSQPLGFFPAPPRFCIAPGLMAMWLPTLTLRSRNSPGTNRILSLVLDPEKIRGQQFAKAPVNLEAAATVDGRFFTLIRHSPTRLPAFPWDW